ncbi:hypothetical protein KC332_g8359 [Hortaea werneckii]|nr:hypothetical protein KC350_g7367 [Hortaea werneckii]KAI6833637.1 hypothetical protein KC358_g6031 [Hortaea werneckii]KAI6834620.1 hypothetical protein KC342_g6186 [Hortaea werneckii]KAI6925532.1 hypothetical protein KC348_g8945 [Hortaea werneckii]KAI6937030.1 hypothetical protein KC341_g5852 [Hortaea werneckii]
MLTMDETNKFLATKGTDGCKKRDNHVTARRPIQEVDSTTLPTEPTRSLLTAADVAVPFFLMHCAGLGRSLGAARGFFETLIPAYSSQSQSSALSLAVSAVAGKVFAACCRNERPAPWKNDRPQSAQYAQAAVALRATIDDPKKRYRPATALAILSMHLYESMTAIHESRRANPIHHDGLLSLLPLITVSDRLDGLINPYVQNYVVHLEVSSALRQARPVNTIVHKYMTSTSGSMTVPLNISSSLDQIGAVVAELHARYSRATASQPGCTPSKHYRRDWTVEAKRIDKLLRDWTHGVPSHWQPLRLTSGRDFDSSIPSYQSACAVYPSCQVATIWNLWRIQRLRLLRIIVGFAGQPSPSSSRDKSDDGNSPETMATEVAAQGDLMQDLIDGICFSIPFYLGNRTRPAHLHDFTDREIRFPSLHSVGTERAKIALRRQAGDDTAMFEDEHRRHVTVNGAWHAMSILSTLLTIISEQAVANRLQPEQKSWICEQLDRVATLLCLPTPMSRDGAASSPEAEGCLPSPMSNGREGVAAEALAEQIQKGALFLSGP